MSEGNKGYAEVDWVERIHRSLMAAGVFDPKRHTASDIDALAADRDRLREDLRVETERVQRITQQRESWQGQTERLREEVRDSLEQFGADAVRVCEGGGPEDLAKSLAVTTAKVCQTLAALRAKGETDAAELVADELPVKRERVWTYSTFMFSTDHPQFLESLRETTWWREESSRAT